MGVLAHFGPKKLDKKNSHNSQRLWTLSSPYVSFFVLKCSNIVNISYSQRELKRFSLEIFVIYRILAQKLITSLSVLNCFKYFQIHILGQMSQKIREEKKFELCQINVIFTKISNDKMIRYSQRFQVAKCSNTSKLYTLKALSIGSISFLLSSDMQKFHHLLGCDAIGINSSFIFFFKFFPFLIFNVPNQNSDKNNSIVIIFINITIKINIKIHIKNTHFITRKFDITRIFIKLEYIFIYVQSSIKFFNHFMCNKPIRN